MISQLLCALLLLFSVCSGYTPPSSPLSRRKLMVTSSASLLLPFLSLQPSLATDATDALPISVYFGAGCFWHVSHDLTVLEAKLLNRSNMDLTGRAAYAGGTKLGKDGKICYHNLAQVAE